METISKANFAKDMGVSKPAITQQAKRGKIALSDSGDVVLDHELTQKYIANRAAKQNPPPKPRKKRRRKTPPVKTTPKSPPAGSVKPKPDTPAPSKPAPMQVKAKSAPHNPPPPQAAGAANAPVIIKEQGRSISGITAENYHEYSKQDIEKAKSYEQTLKIKQERQAKRGDLIERKVVATVFARMYSVEENELKSMEDKLTPASCGVFGVGDDSPEALKVRKLMNKEIAQALRHIKRIVGAFLEEQKEDAA